MKKFAKHVQIAQRLMDDIVDLELEKIDCILENQVGSTERGSERDRKTPLGKNKT